MKRSLKYVLCLIAAVCALQSAAQSYRSVTTRDGLSSLFVFTLYQDSCGRLWAGTTDGVSVLGGNNAAVIYDDRPELQALAGTMVTGIYGNGKDRVWFGTNLLDERSASGRLERHPEMQTEKIVAVSPQGHTVAFNSDRQLWFYHEQQHRFCPLDGAQLPAYDGYHGNLQMYFESDDTLTLLTLSHVWRYALTYGDDGGAELASQSCQPLPHALRAVFRDGGSLMLVGRDNRLFAADPHLTDMRDLGLLPAAVSTDDILSGVARYGGDVYVSLLSGGLLRLTRAAGNTWQAEPTPIRCGVFAILHDSRQDILWVATDGEGIRYLVREPYPIYNESFSRLPFAVSKPVRAICRDSRGDLWVGTKGDGLLRYPAFDPQQPSQPQHYTTDNSALLHNSAYAFCESRHGGLWIATDGQGLNYYSPATGRIEALHAYDPLFINLHDVVETDSTTLYAASGQGLFRVRLSWHGNQPSIASVRLLLHDSKPYFLQFQCLLEQSGELWAATRSNGLYRINLASGRTSHYSFSRERRDPVNDFVALGADAEGRLLACSSAGLLRLTPTDGGRRLRVEHLSERLGHSRQMVRGVERATDGSTWICTAHNILCYSDSAANYRLFTSQDGLQVPEFGEGASYSDPRTGIKYFGGVGGFVAIGKAQRQSAVYKPELRFQYVKTRGRYLPLPANERKPLRLRYNQNYFTIAYAAVDYANASDYTFEYRLNSQPWVDNGQSRSIAFTDVRPGTYRLQVRYRRGGKASPAAELQLRITPPWWSSTPARIGYVLLGLGMLALLVWRYTERRRRRAQLQFFIDLTHRFSTPLMLISGPVQRILASAGLKADIKADAELIQSNSELMNELIQKVIEYRGYEARHLELPEGENDVADADTPLPAPPTQPDASLPTVYLIDDNRQVLALLADLLAPDFNVYAFADVAALQDAMAQRLPDIIVAETDMQPVGGIDLCRELKANATTAHVPIVLLSTDFAPQTRTASADAGADAFMTKPFDIEYFRTIVRSQLRRKTELKEYFTSAVSAFELHDGKYRHQEDRELMDRIVAVINKNITSPELNANFVASELGYGIRSLYRRLAEFTDDTPATLIRDIRLNHAAHLLTTTELTMEEVCFNAGFNNRGTFYKQFAAKYGCTPKQYHERALDDARRKMGTTEGKE